MLTSREFKYMSMEKQAECLFNKGNFVISRIQDEHHVDLYSFNEFFVELWYVNFEDALDENHQYTTLTMITDIVIITEEEDINRYIDLYNKSKK